MPSQRRHEAVEKTREARDGDALLDRRAAADAFHDAQVGVPGDQPATLRDRLNHRQRTVDLRLRDQLVGTEAKIVRRSDEVSGGTAARRTPELAVLTDQFDENGEGRDALEIGGVGDLERRRLQRADRRERPPSGNLVLHAPQRGKGRDDGWNGQALLLQRIPWPPAPKWER